MGMLQTSLIPLAWAIVLGVILYYRFRKDEDMHLGHAERRKGDRRGPAKRRALRTMPKASRFDDGDKRLRDDRRQNLDWREEYRSLKSKLENDHTV